MLSAGGEYARWVLNSEPVAFGIVSNPVEVYLSALFGGRHGVYAKRVFGWGVDRRSTNVYLIYRHGGSPWTFKVFLPSYCSLYLRRSPEVGESAF